MQKCSPTGASFMTNMGKQVICGSSRMGQGKTVWRYASSLSPYHGKRPGGSAPSSCVPGSGSFRSPTGLTVECRALKTDPSKGHYVYQRSGAPYRGRMQNNLSGVSVVPSAPVMPFDSVPSSSKSSSFDDAILSAAAQRKPMVEQWSYYPNEEKKWEKFGSSTRSRFGPNYNENVNIDVIGDDGEAWDSFENRPAKGTYFDPSMYASGGYSPMYY